MKMSKPEAKKIESFEVKLRELEKRLDNLLKEIEFLETRLERLERLQPNIPKDILTF
jgi:chromosome segregation ATPase